MNSAAYLGNCEDHDHDNGGNDIVQAERNSPRRVTTQGARAPTYAIYDESSSLGCVSKYVNAGSFRLDAPSNSAGRIQRKTLEWLMA